MNFSGLDCGQRPAQIEQNLAHSYGVLVTVTMQHAEAAAEQEMYEAASDPATADAGTAAESAVQLHFL